MFRIKKYKEGYVVEIKRNFFGFTYWKHYISYSGLDKPFYFSSYLNAEDELIFKIRKNVVINSRGLI
jgi:hypothetical protein